MKFTKNIKFATVYRNKPISKSSLNALKKAYNINKRLFRRSVPKFKIIICDNEKDFKKNMKDYYFKWGTATVVKGGTLVTRSPEFIEKIGRWKKSDFFDIMKHEMNHVFWEFYYGINKPCWLLEGFASYVGSGFDLTKKQLKKMIIKYKVDYSIIHYRYFRKKFEKGHVPIYPVWAAFTRFLAKNKSPYTIIRLMDSYIKNPIKSNYDKQFKKLFGKTEKELFNEFIADIRSK